MARQDTARIAKAALLALAAGILVAVANPARSIERRADNGMTALDREAVRIVALLEPQPNPAPRTIVRNSQ